jgi:RNA polymerase sigma-70 factor (ECF subfamily)
MNVSAMVVRGSFCQAADLPAANSQTSSRPGGLQNVGKINGRKKMQPWRPRRGRTDGRLNFDSPEDLAVANRTESRCRTIVSGGLLNSPPVLPDRVGEDLAKRRFCAFRHLAPGSDAAFSTWLFALASNLYRTELKRLPPRAESLDQVVVAGGADPEALLGGCEIASAVRAAVAALPGKYRDPIMHYYLHEQDLAFSAAVLGMPEGTFKARLSRGRALLRDRLAKWAGGRR